MTDIKNITIGGIEYKAEGSKCYSCGPCDFNYMDCDNIPCGDDEGNEWHWVEVKK